MAVPRRQALARIAESLNLPNPRTITYRELNEEIDKLPEDGWVHPQDLRDQLQAELDGARPLV